MSVVPMVHCSPEQLGTLLNPIIQRELASIGALDTAMAREDDPGYYEMFLATKSGKQANVGQMLSMLRAEGITPVTSGGATETILKLQTTVMEWLGTTPTLRAMRFVQAELVAHYEHAYGELEGFYLTAIEKAMHRAKKHLMVVTAHIAKRGAIDLEEKARLVEPLANYFAHDEARVCMRCLFDRPGRLEPLERKDPHPYQYICSACHGEVLADFPPDLAEKSGQWTKRELENHLIEKAISRSSKLTAETTIVAKMSGLAPDMPNPPMPYKAAIDVTGGNATMTQPPAEVVIPPVRSLDERLYDELLFDYESVRENW